MTTLSSKGQGKQAVVINVTAEMNKQLLELAVIKGMDVDQLVHKYLGEQIEKDLPMLRRKEYFDHLKTVMKKHNIPDETMKTLEANFLY